MIDLRSDTVTQPTPAMRKAMADAPVGDDVLGDDPTVIQLQELAAEAVGKEAALFTPSGIMANLISLLTMTGRNDEVICGSESHLYTAEVGGVGILGNLFMHVVPNEPDGTMSLESLQNAVRDQVYAPRTRVVSLENTHNRCSGAVLTLEYIQQVASFANERGAYLHLDGARIFNAAAASGLSAVELARPAEVINFCLSKGLGAPVGSMVCGSQAFIAEARRTRRMLGGGMRQAGVLAAAGIVALTQMRERLSEDHALAGMLATQLAEIEGILLDPDTVRTNIVIFDLSPSLGIGARELQERLKERGVLISLSGSHARMVTHHMIRPSDIVQVLEAVKQSLREDI